MAQDRDLHGERTVPIPWFEAPLSTLPAQSCPKYPVLPFCDDAGDLTVTGIVQERFPHIGAV